MDELPSLQESAREMALERFRIITCRANGACSAPGDIWRKDDPRWHVCGIPDLLYTDNGSDFTPQHLEQVAADLKMRLVFSTPGIPRGRGRIERFFSTISDMLLSRMPDRIG